MVQVKLGQPAASLIFFFRKKNRCGQLAQVFYMLDAVQQYQSTQRNINSKYTGRYHASRLFFN